MVMALLCLLLYGRARAGLRPHCVARATIVGSQADHVLLLGGSNLSSDPLHVLIIAVAAWRQIMRFAEAF